MRKALLGEQANQCMTIRSEVLQLQSLLNREKNRAWFVGLSEYRNVRQSRQ